MIFLPSTVHPGRLTWNLPITHLERNMIFQTSMIMVHVNLPGGDLGGSSSCHWGQARFVYLKRSAVAVARSVARFAQAKMGRVDGTDLNSTLWYWNFSRWVSFMCIDGIFLETKNQYKALKWIHQRLSSKCSMSPRMLTGCLSFCLGSLVWGTRSEVVLRQNSCAPETPWHAFHCFMLLAVPVFGGTQELGALVFVAEFVTTNHFIYRFDWRHNMVLPVKNSTLTSILREFFLMEAPHPSWVW